MVDPTNKDPALYQNHALHNPQGTNQDKRDTDAIQQVFERQQALIAMQQMQIEQSHLLVQKAESNVFKGTVIGFGLGIATGVAVAAYVQKYGANSQTDSGDKSENSKK